MFLLFSLMVILLQPKFVSFTAEDGLSSNNVLAIARDRDGFMWFGTENGLDRFDGAHVTVYKQGQIPGNIIMALAVDGDGNLWAGGTEGLCVMPEGGTEFASLTTAHGNYVRALHAASDGYVYAAYFDGTLEKMKFLDGKITVCASIKYEMTTVIEGEYWYQQIYEDAGGVLWLGGRKVPGQWMKDDAVHAAGDRIIGNFAQTHDGTVYGYDDFHPELVRWNGASFENVCEIPVSHARLLCDSRGRLWAAGFYGLALIDLSGRKSRHFLSDREFNCIYEDPQGNIWLGGTRGVQMLSPEMNNIGSFAEGEEVTALLEDRSGEMWVGKGDKKVTCLYEDSAGKVYVGLWTGRGFDIYDKAAGRHSHAALTGDRSGANWYQDFLEDSRGRFWAATWEGIGLNEFDRKSGKFTDFKVDSLSTRLASCLIEDSRGILWYGTTENGLDAIDPDTWKVEHFLKGQYVTCVEEAGDSILAGTKKGLFSIRARRQRPAGLEVPIASIERDNSGRIWVSTAEGLFLLTENGPAKVRKQLGFNSDVYGLKVSCRMQDGSLAFGGNNGYNVFNPDSLLAACPKPDILISNLRKTRNSISLDFGTTDYASAKFIDYRYMLEGHETEWNTARWPNLSVRYSGLSSRRYRLIVQCSDALGRWPAQDGGGEWSLDFRAVPPLLLTWPFILIYIISVFSAMTVIIKFRERSLLRDKAELERAVAEKTTQLRQEIESKNSFFSIVAHDIKNPVIGIRNLTRTLSDNIDGLDRESIKTAVDEITASSSHTSEMLDKILLWALSQKGMIRPDMDVYSLQDIVHEAVETVSSRAKEKGILLDMELDECSIRTDRNLLVTVLRNLISNAVKFTPAGGRVKILGTGSHISIIDSGIGISEEDMKKLFCLDSKISSPGTNAETGSGLGLILCKELLDRLGENITVESVPGRGSTFSISTTRM